MDKKRVFLKGVKASLPVMIGYVPIAISFGVVAESYHFPPLFPVLMSLSVFAGASQFMAIGMLGNGIPIVQIVLATLVINSRHFIMGFSLLPCLENISVPKKAMCFLGLTDETFAIISLSEDAEMRTETAIYGLILCAFGAWCLGTYAGVKASGLIPACLKSAMNIALYAMFIALLVPALLKKQKYLPVVILAVMLNVIVRQVLPEGWALVVATVVSPAIFPLLKRT
ncbi:AzlC family protein [candidate division KSB3 bacterium]|uniref:AzlC family protein n=1 Tax=candidate division KSB3 bacterium TaxID=2044937 RepID=A0A2G6EA06_9BACT|nr:MAG: AzlC family protein [candidate division KSB3 bacterium]PIE30980.1 MAG: AzlC family protein [candidate division KSB3 bacterium]